MIKHSTTANIPHETVENAHYDTINVEYMREYSTTTRTPERVLKSVSGHMRKWHEKQVEKHANREWYVRVMPQLSLSSDKKKIHVYARYQFVDKSIVHYIGS